MNRFILYMFKYKLVYGTICKNTSKHAKSYSIRKLHKNVIILKVQLFFYDKYPIPSSQVQKIPNLAYQI